MNNSLFSKWLGIALIGLFILSGCVQQSAFPETGGQNTTTPTQLPPSPTPTFSPSPVPMGSATETPAPETANVTLADNGKTISLQVVQAFLLALGEGYDWNVTIADQSIISREIGVLTIRGSQGLFMAHTPGTTTLSANGDPTCLQSQPPCKMPSESFQVTIVVK
jgi:hypothetical protein